MFTFPPPEVRGSSRAAVRAIIGPAGPLPAPEEAALTSEPSPHHLVTPPTELPEAVDSQIHEVREVLHADAAAAGVDPQLVDTAVDAAAEEYRDARVHAFIGILVERHARAALHLHAPAPADDAGTSTAWPRPRELPSSSRS
jgi:hypothetical protein